VGDIAEKWMPMPGIHQLMKTRKTKSHFRNIGQGIMPLE
jgi:hypothetical protein